MTLRLMKLTGIRLALMAGLAAATMSDLLAASATQPAANSLPGAGGIIPAIVCYARRGKPIGGWLLYFFWSVFGGTALTAIFLAIGTKNYLPASWNGQHRLYALFLGSTLQGSVAEICRLSAAIAVIGTRNCEWVLGIRSILADDDME